TRHRHIVPCCMISSASHDSVSRLVAERSMCFATASDKAFEKIDCMIAILCCQAKNRLYESSQRLIQPRRVRWAGLNIYFFGVDGNNREGSINKVVVGYCVFL